MISQVFKKIKRNQMIIKWKLNNLNMNLLKSKKTMIKKDKKTSGMSQTKLKMIMDNLVFPDAKFGSLPVQGRNDFLFKTFEERKKKKKE
jgi:hypothetical protein